METKFKNAKKKTWLQKLEEDKPPQIIELTGEGAEKWGGESMVITSPKIIANFIKEIPKGQLANMKFIRSCQAARFNTQIACPLTSGIFLRIIAEAVEEQKLLGNNLKIPYWRVIKDDGSLNLKFPGAPYLQAEYLESEGFEIFKKGKNLFVKQFEPHLIY